MGIFGNPASIIIDVNLIIQWVIFVFLLLGYLKRRDLKTHGYLMVVALILNLVTTLFVMAPSLVLNLATLPITVLPHSAVGTLAILFGLLFSFKFLVALRNNEPLACGTRRNMLIAFALWIVPVFFGT
ncbi:MAG: hypothetical protein ACXACG_12165, partial [Candidatus Thorarchaeota archaeon]